MFGGAPGKSSTYLEAQKKENWVKDIKTNRRKLNIILALCVLALSGAVIGIIFGVLGWQEAGHSHSGQSHQINSVIPTTPQGHYLDSTAIALSMALPNDLSGYVGRVYRIWSRSAKAHIIQIASGGFNPTFDGINKVATFGGAIGDGFVFEVTDKDKIVIISVNNVVFS